ncbi:stealth family protein [Acinetobacter populi]|uniref:Capsular polysaccharide biosynthesis protein n=1 Tax=Acinetobacter populi TaxID=1582270 RepID=A0A1Z9Z2J2_9GAMM|nr:stealth family protein [Acinetobacter populi]OUY08674.1 capsular polysaccharide biosynthesis protein [Acinetobacter populi]
MNNTAQYIDVVIAWVDGNDPKLKQKRQQYLNPEQASDAVSDTRFASNNEIYYNVASILKYVPFCRHIYIVTDQQQPEWIDEFAKQNICTVEKIKIVDHRDIFAGYAQYLPTFNTRSIESMLWNIPGLSDDFIYLNDDFFFNQPADITDFIQQDKMVIYGHWTNSSILKVKLKYRQFLNKQFGKPIQPGHIIAQMLGADILGFKKFFEIHHYPHIVDRKILADYLLKSPELLDRQIRYKFRSVEQLNPISLMNHLKIQKGEAILKPDIEIAYLKNQQGLTKFIQDLQSNTIKYGCIQSLDQLDQDAARQISTALNAKFAGFLPESLLQYTPV